MNSRLYTCLSGAVSTPDASYFTRGSATLFEWSSRRHAHRADVAELVERVARPVRGGRDVELAGRSGFECETRARTPTRARVRVRLRARLDRHVVEQLPCRARARARRAVAERAHRHHAHVRLLARGERVDRARARVPLTSAAAACSSKTVSGAHCTAYCVTGLPPSVAGAAHDVERARPRRSRTRRGRAGHDAGRRRGDVRELRRAPAVAVVRGDAPSTRCRPRACSASQPSASAP